LKTSQESQITEMRVYRLTRWAITPSQRIL